MSVSIITQKLHFLALICCIKFQRCLVTCSLWSSSKIQAWKFSQYFKRWVTSMKNFLWSKHCPPYDFDACWESANHSIYFAINSISLKFHFLISKKLSSFLAINLMQSIVSKLFFAIYHRRVVERNQRTHL